MTGVHVGIGGWNFAPWRGTFYPPGLRQADELAFASRQVTSIEINATFYKTQSPESFKRWRDSTPDGFVFSIKAPRYATHRRELAETREPIGWFLQSGVLELGDRLGPILWQFPPSRQFDPAAMRPFVEHLPAAHAGVPLRHVVETRHPSFADPAWVAMLAEAGIAWAIVESEKHVLRGDLTAPFVYARLERNSADADEGYAGAALDTWAERVRRWRSAEAVTDLELAGPAPNPAARECFIYFISGDKVRAPVAALSMLKRLAA